MRYLAFNDSDRLYQPRREIRNMSITLEWVVVPNGMYLRTICNNGVPLPDPTRYLLSYAYPDHGSTQTVLAYGQWLLPFCDILPPAKARGFTGRFDKWMDRRKLALTDITLVDLRRYRSELTLVDASTPPLLRKGAESASTTVFYAVSAAVRYVLWAMEPDDREPLIRRGVAHHPARRRVSISQLTREDVRSLTRKILPHPKDDLPKFLTQVELNCCRDWIMDTYAFNRQLQLRNRAIFEVLWNGALRKGSLLGLQVRDPSPTRGWACETASAPIKLLTSGLLA